jgi:hypothetical protein
MMRQIQNLKAGRKDRYGASTVDGWSLHMQGALGELVVAKLTGRFWSGAVGDLKADDVGELQVRTSEGLNNRLILHPSDPDDRAFVLVLGAPPTFKVPGWIMGRDGKNDDFFSDPRGDRPAFFVPQHVLLPIDTLGR